MTTGQFKQGEPPQLQETILEVNIPAKTTIKVFNIFEISSLNDMNFKIKIPLFGNSIDLSAIVNSIEEAGGSIEYKQVY